LTSSLYSTNRLVGRLVEWRVSAIGQVADVRELEQLRAKSLEQAGSEIVICVDWRNGAVMNPGVADALAASWQPQVTHVKRSAVLLPQARPTFNLQIERVMRTSDVSSRRSFRDAPALLLWLSDVLTPEELRRASAFLDEASG
jgi:hypothetical protein